jgi:hypothetical protein
MNVKELRIGNIIKYKKGHLSKVIGLYHNNKSIIEVVGVEDNYINGNYESLHFEPVIITSELYDTIQSQLLKKVSYSFSNNILTIYIADYEYKFNYVHSLQNFYFALIGEELQLSSNVA